MLGFGSMHCTSEFVEYGRVITAEACIVHKWNITKNDVVPAIVDHCITKLLFPIVPLQPVIGELRDLHDLTFLHDQNFLLSGKGVGIVFIGGWTAMGGWGILQWATMAGMTSFLVIFHL